jgi:hypothetical protein
LKSPAAPIVPSETPAPPAGVSSDGLYPSATARRAATRQRGELIDRVAASGPVGKLLVVEALRHARVPFAERRPDHRAGVELAAVDAQRAAEAAADLECGLDD